MNLGSGRVVIPGSVVHPRPAHLVGQPGPAALGRRGRGDGQRLFHIGLVLVVDRGVELQDDRHRDPDGLPVGQLELTVDLGGRVDGRERCGDGQRVPVTPDRRTGPGVGDAVAQRLGDGEGGAVTVEHPGDGLAVGIGQGDVLQPAVFDLEAGRSRRQNVLGVVRRGEVQRRLGRGAGRRRGLVAGHLVTRGQSSGGSHTEEQRCQSASPIDRRQSVGWAHVNPRYGTQPSRCQLRVCG